MAAAGGMSPFDVLYQPRTAATPVRAPAIVVIYLGSKGEEHWLRVKTEQVQVIDFYPREVKL